MTHTRSHRPVAGRSAAPERKPPLAAVLLVASLQVLGSIPAVAQIPGLPRPALAEPAPAATETPPTTEAAAPASATPSLQLSARLDVIATNLITADAPTDPPVDPVATAAVVEDLDREVQQRIALASPDSRPTLSPGILDSLNTSLKRIRRDVERTRAELGGAVTQLEDRRSSLKSDAEFLGAVLAVAGSSELPPSLFARSREALAVLGTTRTELRGELDRLVSLDSRLRDLQGAVVSTTAALEEDRKQRREDVFLREQPPLWSVLDRVQAPAGMLAAIWSASVIALVEYVREFPGVWAGLVGLLLLLLGVTFTLRRAMRASAREGDDPADGLAVDPIVQRPVAVAVLIWDVLGPGLFGLDPPIAIGFLRIVIGGIAVWRLLPMLVPAAARFGLRAVLVLAVLASGTLLSGYEDATTRLVVLGISLVAALVLRRLARTLRDPAGRIDSFWGGVLAVAASIGQYLLLGGALVGLAGATTLSEQLTVGALIGSLAPLLLGCTDRILRSIVHQGIQRRPLTLLNAVRRYPGVVQGRLEQLITVVLVIVGVQVLANLFPFLRPAYAGVVGALSAKLTLGGLNVSVLDGVTLAVGIALAVGVARLVRFLLAEDVFPRTNLTSGAAAAATRLVFYALAGIGIVMALAASGLQLSQLTLLVSALGVGIGFGLQNIVSNFVSGIVLAFERPIQPGDQIAVGQMTGQVRDIGLRATTVRTADGADVIVPNSQFISAEVVNWTLADRSRRAQLLVSVAYGSDLREVQRLLREIALANDGVSREPGPAVLFRGFGESGIDFGVFFWANDAEEAIRLTSEVGIAIWEGLRDAGIDIPYPRRDVRIVADDAGASLPTPGPRAATRPAAASRDEPLPGGIPPPDTDGSGPGDAAPGGSPE